MSKPQFLKLQGHEGRIVVAASSQLRLFASGAHQPRQVEDAVRLWDFNGKCVHWIRTEFNGIHSIAFSPDGKYLAVGGGGYVIRDEKREYSPGIEIWKLENLERVARFGNELYFVRSLEFSSDGRLLLSSNYAKPGSRPHTGGAGVKLWRVPDGKQTMCFGEGEEPINAACFLPGDESVVFSRPQGSTLEVSASPADMRKLGQNRFALLLEKARSDFEGRIEHGSVPVQPLIKVWNVHKKREEPPFDIYQERVSDISISPDGRYLVSTGTKTILWDLQNRSKIAELDDGASKFNSTHCASFSSSGNIVAVGAGDQWDIASPYENCGVKLWETFTQTFIMHLSHSRPVYSLAFAKDGSKLIAGGQAELILWDL
jgi:WD40 repeat protein